jgi:peroxiredoxin
MPHRHHPLEFTPMRTLPAVIAMLLAGLATLGFAADPPAASPVKPPPDANQPKKVADGKQAPKFTLEDTAGSKHALEDYAGKTLVLVWINPTCPGTARLFRDGQMKAFIDALDDMNRDKSIAWLGVCSSAGIDANSCESFTRDHKIDMPVLMDSHGEVGKKFEAKKTPHVFVIDADGIIRYEGAFDDDPSGAKKTSGQDVLNFPLQAVQAIRDGREVKPKSTEPYGLPIRYPSLGP